MQVHSAIEEVARESYGRLLAFLIARCGDWSAVEDALAESIKIALELWPRNGIPDRPEAWLLVVARRRLSDKRRQDRRHTNLDSRLLIAEAKFQGDGAARLPDERLEMLFMCAHPAIDSSIHTPLMLQAVFGMTAERIASAFLVRPATMGQRLSRAKEKVRAAKLRFDLPDESQMAVRLNAVLEAVYTAYGTGWDDPNGSDRRLRGLAKESIYLGRLLAALLPLEPEVHGLLALMLYCESRTGARRSETGEYVPLSQQCVDLWSKELIFEAERHLSRALVAGRIGRFQLEAAIQSAHAHRIATGSTNWLAIVELYEALLRYAPTTGVQVNQAAAIAEAYGPARAIKHLERLSPKQIGDYQPYWALMAHLQAKLGNIEAARAAYDRAIGTCEDAAVRRYLIERARTL